LHIREMFIFPKAIEIRSTTKMQFSVLLRSFSI